MKSLFKWINVALRGILETAIVCALAYWGYYIGEKRISKILLGICAPLIGFGFWGLVDFHQFGKMAEWLRLFQELAISGFAAIALYMTGSPILGWALGLLSIVHHALVYLLGGTLLKHETN